MKTKNKTKTHNSKRRTLRKKGSGLFGRLFGTRGQPASSYVYENEMNENEQFGEENPMRTRTRVPSVAPRTTETVKPVQSTIPPNKKEIHYDRALYEGETKGDGLELKRQGMGTLTIYENEDKTTLLSKYEGQFENDQFNGHGNYKRFEKNKLIYEYNGDWNNSQRVGKNGKETYYNQNGKVISIYEGQFENDQPSGQGEYQRFNNQDQLIMKYVGEWKNKFRDGIGNQTEYTHNHRKKQIVSTFVGKFKNNQPNGQGTYTKFNENGEMLVKYEGEWKNNQRHGTGIQQYYDKNDRQIIHIYDGEWIDNKQHGEGVLFTTITGLGLVYSLSGNFQDNRLKMGLYSTLEYKNNKACLEPFIKKNVNPRAVDTYTEFSSAIKEHVNTKNPFYFYGWCKDEHQYPPVLENGLVFVTKGNDPNSTVTVEYENMKYVYYIVFAEPLENNTRRNGTISVFSCEKITDKKHFQNALNTIQNTENILRDYNSPTPRKRRSTADTVVSDDSQTS